MRNDEFDVQFTQALEQSLPPFSPQVKARAVVGMARVRPARCLSRRWVLLAVGAMALFGLGLVPMPLGEAPGALSQAMALAAESTTVHIVGRAWTPSGGYEFERWVSEDGFSRRERREGSELAELTLVEGDWEISYGLDDDGTAYAWEVFDPTRRHAQSSVMPDRAYVGDYFQSFRRLAELMGVAAPDVTVTERQEWTLWGGRVDIVEAERMIEGDASIAGVSYRDGDTVRTRFEIDPTTNRVLSM
ncbi:MAG: hypothetical protein IMF16_05670, partial [Proteobacteria bacterium]|nr:hypothetical protein [Pseudomonadota bacterium]